MSIEKVREHLRGFSLEERVMEFESSSATVSEAAAVLGCSEGEIAKSMSFIIDGSPIIVVAAGDEKINNSKFKAAFHTKAVMVKFEEVEELIGHPAGGVCPFAVKDDVKVFLDESLKRFETVYPAAGTRNSAVRLSIDELALASGSLGWVDVCKGKEE